MRFVKSPYDTEVIDESSVDRDAQARADKRMKTIVATPEEQHLYAYSPNKARGEIDRPGIPCEDYAENTGTAKD